MPPPTALVYEPTPTQPLISFASIFNDPNDAVNKSYRNPFDGSRLGLFIIMLFIVVTLVTLAGIILWRNYYTRTGTVTELESESGAGYSASAEKAILRALSSGASRDDIVGDDGKKIGITSEERGKLRKLILPSLVLSTSADSEKQEEPTKRTWSFLSFLKPRPRLSSAKTGTNLATSTSQLQPPAQGDPNDISVPQIFYEAPTPIIGTPIPPSPPAPLAINLLYVPGSHGLPMRLPPSNGLFVLEDDDTPPSTPTPAPKPAKIKSATKIPQQPLAVLSNQTGKPFELGDAPIRVPRTAMRKQGHMRTPSQHCKENFPGLSVAAEGVEGKRKKPVTFSNVPDVKAWSGRSLNLGVGVHGLC